MRKFTILAAAAIAALAIAAPAATAQGVEVQGGEEVALLGNQLLIGYANSSGEVQPGAWCTHDWAGSIDGQGSGSFEIGMSIPGNGFCGSLYDDCWDAGWPVQIQSAGEGFEARFEVCHELNGYNVTGFVTGDLTTDGSTVTGVSFDNALLEDQYPPAGTGGVVPAFGWDGTLDSSAFTVEATE